MDKRDIFELGRAYLGVFLISIDAWYGWRVTNFIIHIISGGGLI